MRYEKARLGGPWVDVEAAFPPHPLNVVLVQDFEPQAEARKQFVLPLRQHRRRTANYYVLCSLTQQQLAGNQSCLDSLSHANVVRDEEIHPWQT